MTLLNDNVSSFKPCNELVLRNQKILEEEEEY